jgi:hypothetical protein
LAKLKKVIRRRVAAGLIHGKCGELCSFGKLDKLQGCLLWAKDVLVFGFRIFRVVRW